MDHPNHNTQDTTTEASPPRRMRADGRRNLDALLQAALAMFTTAGVDVPVRDIAEKAGVGIGTVYRHFPHRSDLIAAVFRREMDGLAEAATHLAATSTPLVALRQWIDLYIVFLGNKRGLATALHSGEPAYAALPRHRQESLEPAFHALFQAARSTGAINADIDPDDLLHAVGALCMSDNGDHAARTRRMVALMMDGLEHHGG